MIKRRQHPNLKKHSVAFEDAASSLLDPMALVYLLKAIQAQMNTLDAMNLTLSARAGIRAAGGGKNAFSRYERGQTKPVAAVINLFKLLDKHPDLIKELV